MSITDWARGALFYPEAFAIELLDDVISNADIVVLTLPLTNRTRHLINEERLNKFKNTAVLVNISRGAVIDTDALLRHLPNIGGAVLDVFEEEPLSENSLLWSMENVILTPHNSFVGDGNKKRLADLVMKNLI